jgi:hypothetical protein
MHVDCKDVDYMDVDHIDVDCTGGGLSRVLGDR